jgi:hypothetical protein
VDELSLDALSSSDAEADELSLVTLSSSDAELLDAPIVVDSWSVGRSSPSTPPAAALASRASRLPMSVVDAATGCVGECQSFEH